MANTEKTFPLTGTVAEERVHGRSAVRVPDEILDRLRALGDASGTVSDVLDELGVRGTVPAAMLTPTDETSKVVGRALTIRNVPQASAASQLANRRESKLAEIEGHNQLATGDVVVIQGVMGCSNMGGISATIAARQGAAGAVVDGNIRDVPHWKEVGLPGWSRGATPRTGKWRVETVEINGGVTICGIQAHEGDVVLADRTGICFIPQSLASQVIDRAEEIAQSEAKRLEDIASGTPVPELAKRTYAYTFANKNKWVMTRTAAYPGRVSTGWDRGFPADS